MLESVLAKLSGVKPNGNGHTAFCPVHEDASQRLYVRIGEAGNVLMKCLDGCDELKIREVLKLTTDDLLDGRLVNGFKYDVDEEIAEIQTQIDRTRRSDNGKAAGARGEPQSSKLMKLAEDVELFHDTDGETYATISLNSHCETYRIRSKGFREWLAFQYWQSERATASGQAVQDAMNGLAGRARFEGASRSVSLRVAEYGDTLHVDLGNDRWQSVRIAKEGWSVPSTSPVKFRRTRGTLPLPVPVKGGSIEELKRFANIAEDDWPLLLAWLAAVFRPNKPFPVLVLHGEQGSGKSTTAKVLRALIDPNVAAARSSPKDERDLMIAASNSWIISLDNLSSMSVSLSDSLCRLSTGGGFSTRELFSDGEEVLLDVMRPVILNGIDEVISRSDLLDRAILLRLPRLPKRFDETTFWKEFEEAKPRILGALLDALSAALGRIESVTLQAKQDQVDLPRLADFTLWGIAAETGFGLPAGKFLERYRNNRDAVHELVLDCDPFAESIVEFMKYRSAWVGTSGQLLAEILSITNHAIANMRSFPKTPQAVGKRLSLLAPNLREHGVDFVAADRTKHIRELTLKKIRSGDGENTDERDREF